jgi:hydroxypyruvate isomerase
MPRFAANLTTMFTEHDPLDRIQAARDAGFAGVEYQIIYELDPDALARETDKAGVGWSVVNFATGPNLEHGPLVAATPGAEAEWDRSIDAAKRYVEAIRPAAVVLPAFVPPDGIDKATAIETLMPNLRRAGDVLTELNTPVIIEALSPDVWPGAILNTTAEVLAILGRIGHDNIGVEYDVFHMYGTEGPDMVPIIAGTLSQIGNVQFADVPGRHEPGTGEIDFPSLFQALDDMGYDGWTAAEYHPSGATLDSLGWMAPYR